MLRTRKFVHHGRILEVRMVKTEDRYTAVVYEGDRPVAPMEYAVSVLNSGGGAAEMDLIAYLWDTTESDFKRWSDLKLEEAAGPPAQLRAKSAPAYRRQRGGSDGDTK